MNIRTVSEVIVEQLAAWDVEYIFGLPGTTCLGVVDAIRKNNKIKFILNNKELAMISVEQKVEGYPKFAIKLNQ